MGDWYFDKVRQCDDLFSHNLSTPLYGGLIQYDKSNRKGNYKQNSCLSTPLYGGLILYAGGRWLHQTIWKLSTPLYGGLILKYIYFLILAVTYIAQHPLIWGIDTWVPPYLMTSVVPIDSQHPLIWGIDTFNLIGLKEWWFFRFLKLFQFVAGNPQHPLIWGIDKASLGLPVVSV